MARLLHHWLLAQRQQVPNGSATAKAIDYTLKRWDALTRYHEDGDLPACGKFGRRSIGRG